MAHWNQPYLLPTEMVMSMEYIGIHGKQYLSGKSLISCAVDIIVKVSPQVGQR